MPRRCLVCNSKHLKEIDRSLVSGEAYRTVAQRCDISPDAVFRHKVNHLPKALVKAKAIEEVAHGDSLLIQVKSLLSQAERLTKRAEHAGSLDTALRGIGQVRGVLALLGEVSGQLAGKGTQVAIGINGGGSVQINAAPPNTLTNEQLEEILRRNGRPLPIVIEGRLLMEGKSL